MRVIVVDDSMLIRDGLSRLLEDAGVTVAHRLAEASVLEAVVGADSPDAVIIDIRMPPTFTDEGLRAAERIRDRYPAVGVLVLSQHVEPGYALRLVEDYPQGTGYLLKDRVSDIAVLVDALDRVTRGELVIDPVLVARLVGRRRRDDPVDRLSERELEVLSLVAEGLSNEAIAQRLFIGERTVESHIARMLHKLGISDDGGVHRRVLAVLAYLRHSG
ncbi:LuxR C-terminal-related transcriptional regulator [Propionicimonas sp.]|uniref:LuxR C-terminal-related transcriptional regulator n=1 Tax=Propionicimonas sp. TaxID=1955623 RepID=UPI0039E4C62A